MRIQGAELIDFFPFTFFGGQEKFQKNLSRDAENSLTRWFPWRGQNPPPKECSPHATQ